jgi:hypothetical protein
MIPRLTVDQANTRGWAHQFLSKKQILPADPTTNTSGGAEEGGGGSSGGGSSEGRSTGGWRRGSCRGQGRPDSEQADSGGRPGQVISLIRSLYRESESRERKMCRSLAVSRDQKPKY